MPTSILSTAETSGENKLDRAYDILRSGQRPLDTIFAPRTIALIGASEREGSVGRTVLWNLMTHPFGGMVFPVNPNHRSILGIRTDATIADVSSTLR